MYELKIEYIDLLEHAACLWQQDNAKNNKILKLKLTNRERIVSDLRQFRQ